MDEMLFGRSDANRRAAVEAIAKAMTTDQRPAQSGLLPLPEIPPMHAGKLFNMFSESRPDGRAQSLDFYLKPQRTPNGLGIDGAGMVYRRMW